MLELVSPSGLMAMLALFADTLGSVDQLLESVIYVGASTTVQARDRCSEHRRQSDNVTRRQLPDRAVW